MEDYREVVSTIQQLKNSEGMKGRFCELCEKTADYVINFRRRGADKENMTALLQYVCIELTNNDAEACWGHAHINIVIQNKIQSSSGDLMLSFSGRRIIYY